MGLSDAIGARPRAARRSRYSVLPRRSPARRNLALATAGAVVVAALVALGLSSPTVSGRALDVEGNPVAGADVQVVLGGQVQARAHTDGQGVFSVTAARRVDPYKVLVTAPGYAPAQLADHPALILHRLPQVQGRVVDDQGSPVAATLTLSRPGDRTVWTLDTGPDGFFFLRSGLESGNFRLRAEAPDHDTVTQALRLEEDHVQQVNPAVKRLLGTMVLSTDPPGQQPLVDGRALTDCPATPCTAQVPAGRHVLSFENDLFVPWRTVTNLKKGERAALSPRLERKTGTLVLHGPAATDGDLEVDGNRKGGASWTGLVPTGDHVVSFRSSSFWPAAANARLDWNQTTDVALNPEAIKPADHDGFLHGLQGYLAAFGGGSGNQYSVYMQDLGSGSEIASNDNALLEAASVIKVPLALYVYKQAEQNKLQLDDQVTLKDEDFMGGTGTLYGSAHAGDKFSYRDLVALLIQQSDNTAWKALNHNLGADKVDSYSGSIGAPDCDQWADNCSARQMGAVLAGLARGKLLNADDTQAVLKLLQTTVFNDRINYYLGGAAVAHKVGMDGGVINDAGIVYMNGSPFVVVVFTTTNDPNRGVQAIRDIARAGAHYFGH